MSLSLIVAHDLNYGIGNKGKLGWNLPSDLKWFKENTLDKTVVMGSSTYFSLPKKIRPLPNRNNIILTSRKGHSKLELEKDGVTVINSIDDIKTLSQIMDIFIIGGSNVYEQFIDDVEYFYITLINDEFECDKFFNKVDYSKMKQIYKSDIINENNIKYTLNIFKKQIIK